MQKIPFADLPAMPPRAVERPAPEAQDIDVVRLLSTLWYGKWIIGLFMALGILAGIANLLWVAVPKYTATTVVALQDRQEQVVDFDNVLSGLGGDQTSINTEVQVLQARGLIGKLVDDLGLTEDPEFNEHIAPPDIFSLGYAAMQVKQLFLGAPPREAEPSARKVHDDTVDEVLKTLGVSNLRQSYVFQLTFTTRSAEKSALMADRLADLYIDDQLEVKFEANRRASGWLADQVSTLETELENAENAVKAFSMETNLISADALTLRNRQLKDFRDRYGDAELEQAALRSRLRRMEEAVLSNDVDAMSSAARDTAVVQAFERLQAGGETEQAVFYERFSKLRERLDLEIQALDNQTAALRASIDELEGQVTAQSSELLRLQQLEREAQASRLIYEYFLGRLKETRVAGGIQQADSRLLSRAVVPDRTTAPRSGLRLAIGALIGMVIGMALVLLREFRNSAFRTAEDIEEATGLTVLGQIPRAPHTRRRRVLDYIASKPDSAMVESIRNMRTSILLTNVDTPPEVIMMTSSVPGEGKTTQSLGLAQNLGSMGKKVLLIEGDIRRRTFQEYFQVKDRLGLLSVVSGDVALEDAVYYDDLLQCDVLIGEKSTVNAADFFSSAAFAAFVEQTRETYDFVIIDTPPVRIVPDARVIGQHADAVIYVVHWNETPRRQVIRGLQSFATVNVPVTGLVLSQYEPKSMKRYGDEDVYGKYAKGYYTN